MMKKGQITVYAQGLVSEREEFYKNPNFISSQVFHIVAWFLLDFSFFNKLIGVHGTHINGELGFHGMH